MELHNNNNHHHHHHRHRHHHNQYQQQQQQQQIYTTNLQPVLFSSLPTSSHCLGPGGGEDVGMFSLWSLESGKQCWGLVDAIRKCTNCSPRQDDEEADAKRWNFFTWVLGLGFHIATTIYGFSANTNSPSCVSLWVSVVLSFATALSHIYITSQKLHFTRKSWILSRFVLSLVGVTIVTCMTAIGTFIADETPGLFVFCGLASIVCYVLAGIDLSRRLYWEWKRDFADVYSADVYIRTRGSRSRTSGRIPTTRPTVNVIPDNLAIIYNERDGQLEMVRTPRPVSQPGTTRFIMSNNNNNNNNMLWNTSPISLPLLTIPSYADVISESDQTMAYQPPEYTELDLDFVLQENPSVLSEEEEMSGNHRESPDSPPEYQENVPETEPQPDSV